MVCEGRGSDLGWKKRLTRNKQEFLGNIEEGAKKREYHKFILILSNKVISFFSGRIQRCRAKKVGD